MPIRDVAAQNVSLDNDYDAMDCEIALFVGDPENGGVELDDADCPGYARTPLPSSSWLPAANGRKQTSAPIALCTPTGAWTTEATHRQLFATEGPSDGAGWDNAELTEPLEITGAGDPPNLLVTIKHADLVPTE